MERDLLGYADTPRRGFVHFLDYARQFPDAWFARRVDTARWWLAHHPPGAVRSGP
jgi:hypothetical protein